MEHMLKEILEYSLLEAKTNMKLEGMSNRESSKGYSHGSFKKAEF
jgi:hypothetical protein